MKVAGLFSGIGGLELGFKAAGYEAAFMCEVDPFCRSVLQSRFPDVEVHIDVRSLKHLPHVDVVLAGFPCQPYSQAGSTLGLTAGKDLLQEMIRVIRDAKSLPTYVILENVKNILHLANGEALRTITLQFEKLGYTWAYRLIDTHAFGIPQRRQRWIFVASLNQNAPSILFDEEPLAFRRREEPASAHGFYWTEGNRGLGWADDAIPPLKSGSTIGIPSPPAIWVRESRSIVTPHIRDAERLQGFPAGWTDVRSTIESRRFERYRWKMVGNAVSAPAATWIANRLKTAQSSVAPVGRPFIKSGPWPKAAWGSKGFRYAVPYELFCRRAEMVPILQFLSEPPPPLSVRATQGFRRRLERSPLRYPGNFLTDLLYHEQRRSAISAT